MFDAARPRTEETRAGKCQRLQDDIHERPRGRSEEALTYAFLSKVRSMRTFVIFVLRKKGQDN